MGLAFFALLIAGADEHLVVLVEAMMRTTC
jgi:hypothetical protein